MSEFADRILLAPEPTAASRAREFIRDRLRAWEAAAPDPAVEDAVLLGSEPVANAVQHAGTGVEVGCRVVAGCRDLSACAVAARIQRAVSEFGVEPPSDDMAVLVLRAIGG